MEERLLCFTPLKSSRQKQSNTADCDFLLMVFKEKKVSGEMESKD